MLDHRIAATAVAPPARRPLAGFLVSLLVADGTRLFRAGLAVHDGRVRLVLDDRRRCACDGWRVRLVHVDLLALRVQSWTVHEGTA